MQNTKIKIMKNENISTTTLLLAFNILLVLIGLLMINKKILILKIILVSILAAVGILSLPLLIKSGNTHFKHMLEWNYFVGVVLFYLLSRFFWKRTT